MSHNGHETEGPLWADGDMMFRVGGVAGESDRLVKVRRPFALIGRSADADITLDDRAVSARHAYLHLDPRGVYAVDLVTRTGTRINGTGRMVGWLRPGDWVEVAGRRIELVRIRLGGAVVEPPPCEADMLADNAHEALVGVVLEPRRSNDPPWELGSELVFLGWSASCGIQVKDTAVSRTHCALFRSTKGAYLVDLCGRQTWVEEHAVRGASPLRDGDLITIGSTQFTARIEHPARTGPEPPRAAARGAHSTQLARYEGPPAELSGGQYLMPNLPINPDLIPAEAQTALMAWMMGTIQGGQVEALRRQGEFQLAMTEVLHQIRQENAALLNTHLQRIEGIDHEIGALRAELERRHARPAVPPPPDVTPLRIARPVPAQDGQGQESQASTTWLLSRVNELEDENRSAWKDLLGRLSHSRKAT